MGKTPNKTDSPIDGDSSWRRRLKLFDGEKIWLWEFYAAMHDEGSLELQEPSADTDEALRWIDQKQIDGTYESERAKLKAKVMAAMPAPNPSHQEALDRIEKAFGDRDQTWNLTLGCRSPDPEEREGFLRLLELIKEKSLSEVLPILKILITPTVPKGRRPQGRPSSDDQELLRRMKPLVAQGASPWAAARTVAEQSPGHSVDATHRRLQEWWRWKQERRSYSGD